MSLKKILIADDHSLTRKGLELLLRTSFPTTEIVEACNGNEVITQSKLHTLDVLLLDYNMPDLNGYEAAHVLLRENKGLKIVLLTMYDTKPVAFNFLKIGGKGLIWKGGSPAHIADGVRAVASGDYYFSSENEKDIVAWLENGVSQKVPKIKFSPLEISIAVKISKGKTSKEIGEELNLSLRTIETYRYDLIRKAEVKNSFELVEFFFKNGIGH
jgi:DNA-binding NarL/FixJ family response regulator